MYTTLEKIRAHSPCAWAKLLAHLGKTKSDSTPLPLAVILESNGLDDTLWCLRAVDGFEREKRLYAVWCVRQVQHLLTGPGDLVALDVAEQFANGLASPEELAAAAWDATWDAAGSAAGAAVWAARDAAGAAVRDDAAWAASDDAAGAAARDAAGAAAWAASDDAAWAARDAAWAAAKDAARGAQTEELKRVLACRNDAAWAARDAAWVAAKAATRASQTQELKRVLACTEAGIDPYPPKEKQPCSQQD